MASCAKCYYEIVGGPGAGYRRGTDFYHKHCAPAPDVSRENARAADRELDARDDADAAECRDLQREDERA